MTHSYMKNSVRLDVCVCVRVCVRACVCACGVCVCVCVFAVCGHVGADLNSAFLKLCELCHELEPLSGCARFLAGLFDMYV